MAPIAPCARHSGVRTCAPGRLLSPQIRGALTRRLAQPKGTALPAVRSGSCYQPRNRRSVRVAAAAEKPEEEKFNIKQAEALLEKEDLPDEYRKKIEGKIAEEERRLEEEEATARVSLWCMKCLR